MLLSMELNNREERLLYLRIAYRYVLQVVNTYFLSLKALKNINLECTGGDYVRIYTVEKDTYRKGDYTA